MDLIKKVSFTSALLLSVSALDVHAALYDRGNGMIYDSAQDITWLQDANYAMTSGYDADGKMLYSDAYMWAQNLVYGGATGWRLPSANLLIGDTTYSTNGSTDYGYNNTRGEIGHLFYELGNKGSFTTAGTSIPSSQRGVKNSTFTDPDSNLSVSFSNLYNDNYWYTEQFAADLSLNWIFSTYIGMQRYCCGEVGGGYPFEGIYAWAVHDGDVANMAVPAPAAAWLFGSGLLGLAAATRRKVKAG